MMDIIEVTSTLRVRNDGNQFIIERLAEQKKEEAKETWIPLSYIGDKKHLRENVRRQFVMPLIEEARLGANKAFEALPCFESLGKGKR